MIQRNGDGMFRWDQETRKRSVLISAKGTQCGEVERLDDTWRAYLNIEVRKGVDFLCIGYFGTESVARQAVIDWWTYAAEQARGLGL